LGVWGELVEAFLGDYADEEDGALSRS
jgi:hypothetical protein